MSGVLGARKGVRRGNPRSGGSIFVNGHPQVSPRTQALILDYIKRVDRPVTAAEVAAELTYARPHISNVMRWMRQDGVLSLYVPPQEPYPNVYQLPGFRYEPEAMFESTKQCALCLETLPISRFGKDRGQVSGLTSRCRECRTVKVREPVGGR